MKKAIEWMADNHVAANLLMVFVFAAGLMAFKGINVEVFPEVAMDMVQIQMSYPGASPDEIEESIIIKIEEQIRSLEGISRITSTANENIAVINAELELGEDLNEMKDKIKNEIDRISSFPENALEPVIKEAQNKYEVIQLAVYGDTDEKTLKKLATEIRDDLLAVGGISQIEISGTRNFEISIEISEEKLRAYNISFEQVALAIKKASVNLPGGRITTNKGEILLRTDAQASTKEDFDQIIVSSTVDAQIIYLKDIAHVRDEFEDSELLSKFNSKNAAIVQVYRVGNQSALDIAETVQNYIKSKRQEMPKGIDIQPWMDQSRILKSRIDLLSTNAMQGIVLVIICLALFMEVRLALWVAGGMVFSIIGSFILMNIFDASINMISLFAFILVIGIVVDDGIVIGENIYTYREQGLAANKAAKKGILEVFTPVFFSVSTTIAAFAPLLFVEGFMGKFMNMIPIIVISVLVLSLIESIFVLPAHLSSLSAETKNPVFQKINRLSKIMDKKLEHFITIKYSPVLRWFLENKYLSTSMAIGFLIISVGLISSGAVKFVFFPEVEADNMIARISLPVGTTLEQTMEQVTKLETAALKVKDEIDSNNPEGTESIFRNIYSVVGDQPMIRRQSGGSGQVRILQGNIAEVNIELLPSEKRTVSANTLVEMWRKNAGTLTGVKSLTISASLLSSGSDVQIEFTDRNFEDLQQAMSMIQDSLAGYAGVYDIRDDYEEGKIEYKFTLKESASTLGISLLDIAKQVRQGFNGEEVMRIQRARDEVKVMLRYPESERKKLSSLESVRIRTVTNNEVPLLEVANVTIGPGYAKIKRSDGNRVISLIADVDEQIVTPNEINTKIKSTIIPELQKQYPNLRFFSEGQQKQQEQALSSIANGFLIALMLIYTLLAIPFRSYTQPLIVMAAIPFGLIGAIWGHLLFGMDISMMSMFGLVALSGIVVNDSLVLVEFINKGYRGTALSIIDAIVDATQKRFRPILLTSLTTFLGLTPIMLEKSTQAKFLIPMALSLGFGVLFATIICLIIIPVGILIIHDWVIKIKGHDEHFEISNETQEQLS